METADLPTRDHYLDRLRSKSSCAGIDWGSISETFDHRRFISFGLVNGLLDRVHNFPFLLEVPAGFAQKNSNISSSFDETTFMAHNVASMMDGMHCDDHIVSIFEKPLSELIEIVEKLDGKPVLSTYSVDVGR